MIRLRSEWNEVKIGTRFGRLTVIGPQFRFHAEKGKPRWAVMCECECSRTTLCGPGDLRRGFTASCGCWRIDSATKMGNANRRHGETGEPLHNLWHIIKIRCLGPTQPDYPNYGGRGITICEQWKNSYEVFRDYVLSHGYKPGLQIDRIDNEGHYEPGNIRFVTCKQNNRNKRNTIFLDAFGEKKSLAEWVEDSRCKVRHLALWQRIKSDWDAETAIVTASLPRGLARRYPEKYKQPAKPAEV